MKVPFSSATLWKYVFLVLNCLVTGVDVLLISCGVVALGSAGSLVGAYTAATIGFTIMFIAFTGTMAAVRQSQLLTWATIALTVLSIILETICMIVFVVLNDNFTEMAEARIEGIWDALPAEQQMMDEIQTLRQCCGRESPQDYLQHSSDVLPKSCCNGGNCALTENIYPDGCIQAAVNYFDDQSDNLILILLGVIALQVLSVVAAYYYLRCIRHRTQKREQIIINTE